MDFDSDGGRTEECVVDEALMNGALYACDVPGVEAGGDVDEDAEVVEARRIFALVAGNADSGAFDTEFVFAEVGGGVKGGAGTERGEQEFGRGHAFVETSVFRRLVGYDDVPAAFDFELNGSEMLDCDFHDGLHDIASLFALGAEGAVIGVTAEWEFVVPSRFY